MMIQLINDHEHQQQHQQELDLCHPRPNRDLELMKGVLQISPKKKKKEKQRQRQKTFETPQQIYHANLIINNLQQSSKLIEGFVQAAISKKIRFYEDRVYLGVMGQDQNYMQRLFAKEEDQNFRKDAISQLFDGIHNKIQNEIYQGQHEVHNKIRITKEELMMGSSPLKFKRLRDKLKDNLNELKQQIVLEKLNAFTDSVSDPTQFTDKSQKTQRAKQFVVKMQQKRQQQSARKQQRRREQEKLQVKSMQQKRQIQQTILKQRHNMRRKAYQEKQQERKKEKQITIKQQQLYQKYLVEKKNNKPLFKKKQQEFYKHFIIEQNRKKHAILMKIKEERKSIDLEDINDHWRRHQEMKQQILLTKQQQREYQLKQAKKFRKKYFKSKLHKSLVRQMEQDSSEDQFNPAQLYKKRWQYANMIKQKYMPKISHQKRRQLEQILNGMRWIQQNMSKIKDPKQQGKKNLDKLHQFIKQLKAKGKIKPQTYDPSPFQSTQQSYPNYLQQLRKNAANRYGKSKTIDYQQLVQKDIDRSYVQASKLDLSAKRRQAYLKNSYMKIDQHLLEKSKLDQQYINSARVKLALLNKIQSN